MEEVTEKWLPVLGFETSYEVSNLGRVRSLERPCAVRGGGTRILKGRVLKNKINYGYHSVNLSYKGKLSSRRVSRLVLEAFSGPEPTLEARHLDGNKNNNKLSNLKWGTHTENEADKVIHGTKLQGSLMTKCAKLDETKVSCIRRRIDAGEYRSDIAKEFGLATSTIDALYNRVTWKHVP